MAGEVSTRPLDNLTRSAPGRAPPLGAPGLISLMRGGVRAGAAESTARSTTRRDS